MARISGVTIPSDKIIVVALTYVYGIGPKTSADILKSAKIDETVQAKDLTDSEISKIQEIITEKYTVEGELQRIVSTNIKRLKDIKSYRGIRHQNNLPSRGRSDLKNVRRRARIRNGSAATWNPARSGWR